MKQKIIDVLPNTGEETLISQFFVLCTCVYDTVYDCRPNWIRIHGQEYHPLEFVTIGFQPDDLPTFGQIDEILLVRTPILSVKVYTTLRINSHHSYFAIVCGYQHLFIHLTKLVHSEPLCAHQSLGGANIYIAMRSNVVNVSL